MSKTLNNLHKVSFLTKEPTSFGYNFIFGVKVNTKKLVSKPGSILALIKKNKIVSFLLKRPYLCIAR